MGAIDDIMSPVLQAIDEVPAQCSDCPRISRLIDAAEVSERELAWGGESHPWFRDHVADVRGTGARIALYGKLAAQRCNGPKEDGDCSLPPIIGRDRGN